MDFSLKKYFSLRVAVTVVVLMLAAGCVVLAFPATHGVLRTSVFDGVVWVLLVALAGVTLRACWKHRWVSACFHLGALCVGIGGGITAGYASESRVGLVDSPIAPMEFKQRIVGGDRVTLKHFDIERYPSGMPSQYRTQLFFPEGEREVSVNHPVRRKGFTYYQMSYSKGMDPYGREVLQTELLVRKDPGASIVFAGFGLLVTASVLAALRVEKQA